MKDFISRHTSTIKACLAGALFGALAALAVLAGVLFGYFKVSPTDTVNIEIKSAVIEGTKDDGSPINGFIIKDTRDNTEYLITDYWTPIMLSDDLPEE